MTNYPGDATATESPSPAPGPGVVPIVTIPVDTVDPVNSSTVAQSFKVLADFIAWLTAPFAIALAWAQEIVSWSNARGQKISGIDHFGFWKGRTYGWTENWRGALDYAVGGVVQRTVDGWRQVITTAGGSIDCPDPGATGNPFVQSRAIRFTTDPANLGWIDQSNVGGGALASDDGVMIAEFDFYANSLTNTRFRCGLCGPPGVPGDIDMTNGCYIEKSVGTTDFKCYANANPDSFAADSGVAAAATTVFRLGVVIVGLNRADDSARHALYFINGVKVADFATFIPLGEALTPFFYAETEATGGSAVQVSWGIVDYRQTTAAAGVF
jgi:hypothetical protein